MGRVKVGIDKRKYEGKLFACDMNPHKMCLRIGQKLTLPADEGKKTAVIKKLYRNHALCLVNGRFMESYTYNELACLLRRKEPVHE